jgi:hypothetical protein
MIKNITMKPSIGYFSYMKGVSRFEFIYPEASGYKNWIFLIPTLLCGNEKKL